MTLEELKSEARISTPKLNKKKAKEAILYLISKGINDSERLKSILYFLDFDYYEKHESHFLGFKFIK